MPALLSSRVFLYPKTGTFPTRAALLELNPDKTVRLTEVDADSGAQGALIFGSPLGDLQVGGSGSTLTFTRTQDGNSWRVDFSPYNAGQRVITAEQANLEIFKPSNARSWAAKLSELGYPASYSSAPNGRIILLIILGVAIATVAVILIANLGHPIFS
jgi:hypothetical protein